MSLWLGLRKILVDELLESPLFELLVHKLLDFGLFVIGFRVDELHTKRVVCIDDTLVMQLLLQETVEAIFDGVVRTPRHLACEVRPLAAVLVVKLDDLSVLLESPRIFVDGGVQV